MQLAAAGVAKAVAGGMMSTAAGAGTIGAIHAGISAAPTLLAVGGAATSAIAQRNAGAAQAAGMKMQAYQEKLRAQEEGNIRRERLLNALASQNVRAGAAGIKGGTVDALRLESQEAYEREQRSADLMSSLEQSRLHEGARSAKRSAKYQAAGSLLSAGTKLASIG